MPRCMFCLIALIFTTLASLAAAPDAELRVNDATLVENASTAALSPAKDRFGPGLDSVDLPGVPLYRAQLQYPCKGVPEGDYSIGLLTLGFGYVSFAENIAGSLPLYLNDTRLPWTTHTEPLLPENAAEKNLYQAEMRSDPQVHIRPGDVLRVVYAQDGSAVTVGPMRLYRTPPDGGIVKLGEPDWGKAQTHWLVAKWEPEQREGDLVRQPVTLYNPGVLPRALSLDVVAKSYEQRILFTSHERITLQPREKLTKTVEVTRGGADRVRLSLAASTPGVFPDVRLSRFYVQDRRAGPRPTTCLNGEWEMCFVPGVEPGDAPPADAKWEQVIVPSQVPNKQGHCAWYRKAFDAPAHLQGDRIMLKCDQALSEVWFYANGQLTAHELHGSQPFEVDITKGFRPGQRNELLVACRDWLAYSPRNRERVLRGEEPVFKDSMVDVAGYPGASNIGIGGSVWLEGRPAVSVEDVFIVTSVRHGMLTLKYRLRNAGDRDQAVGLRATILDAGEVVKDLPRRKVQVRAGGTAELTLEQPWPKAHLWSHEDPHLYVLQTDLEPQAGAADRHVERFGFRELWIDGISFVLNGTRVKIRSAWAGGASGVYAASPYWEPEKRLAAIWDWQMISKLDRDVQLTRTHNMGGVGEAVDLADETGLMVKIEDADVAQTSFTFDQTFWNNALKHELRVVDTFKNHASVVMWSAGNENMWGWIYQGEAAKTLGNRWQIKIVKAMREFDLMARPIEWEADGDLMGGWEHHALHYPFELSQHPDVPDGAFWGPLDGKSVVKYSMGDITLGQKPLTVGEAFWPATLSHPYGETILLGDAPYMGANYWAMGCNAELTHY